MYSNTDPNPGKLYKTGRIQIRIRNNMLTSRCCWRCGQSRGWGRVRRWRWLSRAVGAGRWSCSAPPPCCCCSPRYPRYPAACSPQWTLPRPRQRTWYAYSTCSMNTEVPIFRRFHGMPWPPIGSLNISGLCLTIFRCLYYINIDISKLQTGI